MPFAPILELQRLVGNAAVTQVLRAVDTSGAALDDPSFNAESIAHDLLRAIDQKQYTVVWEDGHEVPEKERRNVDVAKVVEVLENRTPSQIAEIERRYLAFEGRELKFDLFEGGESNRKSSLNDDQRARIGILLRGTRGEPVPDEVQAELKKYPPQIAAQIGAALAGKANRPGAMRQFEADAIEVHELLLGALNDASLERLMLLFRRPMPEVKALEGFFDQHYGVGNLDITVNIRLARLPRSRLGALRQGDWARADAFAIEEKRRKIEALTKEDASADESDVVGNAMHQVREKKKAELSGEIEAILDANRKDALKDPANAGKSSAEAVTEKLNAILNQRVGDSGTTLGGDLAKSLPSEHARIVSAAADTWNTSGSASLIESAAAELVAMEKDHTTTAVRMIETLKSFRTLAEHDLRAHVLDPSVKPEEKAAIGADLDAAVTGLAQQYIAEYRAAYQRQRGEGRSYDDIVKSASSADETYIGDLMSGGGRTSALGELQHAMDKKDIERVKQILRDQPGQEAIQKLVTAYNRLGDGRDLLKELFGSTALGETVDAHVAATQDVKFLTHALLSGRDAALVQEQLQKPSAADLSGKQGVPGQMAEVNWLATGGTSEYEATMENRGVTGKAREIGGDPETERLLKESTMHLVDLQQQFALAKSAAERQHLLLEIRKTRAALTGDADAYEKDNERVLGEIRGALSFAVSIALAIAIPGAGAGLAAFIETTAITVAANVAANMVIKGGDYGWADLKGDVLGGVLGAAGGKFGEELLGRVATKISGSAGKAAASAGEKVGLETALGREISNVAATGEHVTIAAEEFEAREVGHEAATGLTLEKGAREVGAFFGGIYGGKIPSGEFGLSVEEVLQAMAGNVAGKAAHHYRARGVTEGGARPQEEKEHSTTQEEERPAPQEETRTPVEHEEEVGAPLPLGDALGPRSTSEMLLDNGMQKDVGDAFQLFADQLDVVVKVRPTNRASLGVLEAGGLPKAEIVKAKTLNRTDMLIGGPPGQEGKVGFFQPTMPPAEILEVLSPEARKQVESRFKQRQDEYNHYKDEYARLAAEGLIRIDNKVLQLADPREPGQAFKDVGGDHDVFDIRHSDGSPLSADERALATAMLRSMNINVEHGFHLAWEQDSPATYSKEGDEKIRQQHMPGGEGLIAFIPKSAPREVFADTEVHGPERKVGDADPHHPLKTATVTEKTYVPGPDEPGGGPGRPGETDFSDLNEPRATADTVRHARGAGDDHVPDVNRVEQVLPMLRASRSFLDQHTAAIIDARLVHVEHVEDLPRLNAAEMKQRGADPSTDIIVRHPRLGEVRLPRDGKGHALQGNEIVISRNMTPEDVIQTLRHEVNHVLRAPSPAGSVERYQQEFDAYWIDGSFDNLQPPNLSVKAKAIREHILASYADLNDAYNSHPEVRAGIDKYTRPQGNTLNSVVWSNVEAELTSTADGREERAIEDLRTAPADERRRLEHNQYFMRLLETHLKGKDMTAALAALRAT